MISIEKPSEEYLIKNNVRSWPVWEIKRRKGSMAQRHKGTALYSVKLCGKIET